MEELEGLEELTELERYKKIARIKSYSQDILLLIQNYINKEITEGRPVNEMEIYSAVITMSHWLKMALNIQGIYPYKLELINGDKVKESVEITELEGLLTNNGMEDKSNGLQHNKVR